MATFHEFDEESVQAAVSAAREHYSHPDMLAQTAGAEANLADDGHLAMAAGCISVKVEDGKICLKLPLGLGNVCLPIPKFIPDGTAAEACLHICTTWGIPTGVRVTVSALGKQILSKSFGKC